MKKAGKILGVFAALVVLGGLLEHLLPEQMARGQVALQHRLSGLHLAQVQIPGFDIPYLEGGPPEGEPLVLVHGFGADKDNFDRVAMYLTGTFHVISLDLPGYGEASKPADADYGIPRQVERLGQFLGALHLQRVHLGGNSMGGWIVATYAAAHPERVASLWLLDPAGVSGAKPSEVVRAYTERGEFLLLAKTQDDFERILNTVMVHPPFLPWSVKHVLAARAIANYGLHARIFRDLSQSWSTAALEPRVTGLATPTLIVWGERDRATDVSGAEILHQLMPRSQVVIMPDVGHLPHLEAAKPTAAAYLAFRRGLR